MDAHWRARDATSTPRNARGTPPYPKKTILSRYDGARSCRGMTSTRVSTGDVQTRPRRELIPAKVLTTTTNLSTGIKKFQLFYETCACAFRAREAMFRPDLDQTQFINIDI